MDRPESIVYVVDDDDAVRGSLRALFDSVGLATALFDSAESFLEAVCPGRAGCLVLDARLPEMSGLELQERLCAAHIDVPIVMITGNADVAMAVRAMKAGAMDFLEKPFSPQLLLERVQQALRASLGALARQAAQAGRAALLARLTRREHEVVRLVASGRANKEIARMLEISQKTVELHRAKAMRKLGARHVADLVRASIASEENV